MPPSRVGVSRRRMGFLSFVSPNRRSPTPGGDREDLQPQLVDQVMLDQRAYELKAADDDDVPVHFAASASRPR